ncbi:MAG: hypothetical protein U0871_24425 [Gemmataceae bacterium]
MVAAGHTTPDHAWGLSVRELSCYLQRGEPSASADNAIAAVRAEYRVLERRRLLAALSPTQKAELAGWKAKLCR